MVIKGTTRSGFAFEVDNAVLDDMEFIDAMAETSDGSNYLSFSKIGKMLFGEEQRKRLYDFLREKDGRVSVTAVSDAVADVMMAFGEAGKNG